jgi:hypothetical protein
MEGWQALACGVVSFGMEYGKDLGKMSVDPYVLYFATIE